MQANNHELSKHNDDIIDIRKILNTLFINKIFIIGLTSFGTIVAAIILISLPPLYLIQSSFTSPNQKTLDAINIQGFLTETSDGILMGFLNQLSSSTLQRKVLFDGDYLNQLYSNAELSSNNDILAAEFISSISVPPPNVKSLKAFELENFFLTKRPYTISIQGENEKVLQSYLTDLINTANIKNLNYFQSIINQKIEIRLKNISLDRNMLLAKAYKDRISEIVRIKESDAQKLRDLNFKIGALRIKAKLDRMATIKRIKESDAQKLRELNDTINMVKYSAKQSRLNEIDKLTDAAILAGNLGIIENNLGMLYENYQDINLNIPENADDDEVALEDGLRLDNSSSAKRNLPDWYLFGEKALKQRIEILKNRTNDDSFIPELVTLNNEIDLVKNNNILKTLENRFNDDPFIPELIALNNQISEIQNNSLLETLEKRLDDTPFILEIVSLDVEKMKLNPLLVDFNGLSSIVLRKTPESIDISQNKRFLLILAFIFSFLISTFLALLMDSLKPKQ